MNRTIVVLEPEMMFEFNKELKVGHIRADFADGGQFNKWFPQQELTEEESSEIQGGSKLFNVYRVPDI